MGEFNVIFLGSFQYPFGMAGTKRIQHFMDFLQRQACIIHVLIIRPLGKGATKEKIKGQYKGINYLNIGYSLRLSIGILWQFPKFLVQGFIVLIRWKSNTSNILFVYSRVTLENFLIVLFSRMIGYKVVIDIVEDITYFDEQSTIFKRLRRNVIAFFNKRIVFFCDGVIVISKYLFQKYEKLVNNKIPVLLIPISATVDISAYRTPFTKERIIIAYAGSFGKKDGLKYLAKAFRNISEHYPNCELHMVGNKNFKDKSLINIANKNIRFFGYLNDHAYYEFLNDADILCMTRNNSIYANAGFPFKLGEYLATGKPVIATRVSNIEDYLEEGKDAMLVKPENVNEISSAMEFLIQNQEKARKIGLCGRDKCRYFFNPTSNGKLLYNFFKKSFLN